MKTKLTLVIILCSFINAFSQWQPTNGLFSGEVHSVITSNNEIIVGTSCIYKSSDNGRTWNISNNGITNSVAAIRSLVKIGSNIVAGTGEGVFYSTDNGNNWTQSAGTASLNVWCIVIKGTSLFMTTNDNGVYKSTNNGVNWTACNTGISTFTSMRSIAVKGNNIFAATDGYGIYRSQNDGGSWTTVNTGLPGSYYTVSALAVSGTNVIAGTYGAGAYKSTNDGSSWTAVNNGISSADYIMGMGLNGNSLYASTIIGNLYKTTDCTNWNSVSLGTFTATRFEAFHSSGGEFYVGCWSYGSTEKSYGVFKTGDDGATWQHIGITDFPVSALEVSGNNILAGTHDITGNSFRTPLYKTTETDSVWTFSLGGFDGQNITALKANGAVMYLFDDAGPGSSLVYRSTNNGSNWTSTGYSVLYNHFTTFAIAGTLIYAGDDHVYVSSDNGATFNQVNTGIPSSVHFIYSLALKGTLVFAATDDGIYKNSVGANNWTAVNNGLTNLIIRSIFVSGGTIYAGTQGSGIFKSSNDGAQWTEVNSGIPLYTNVTCFTASGGTVITGTGNGVFTTTDNGATWQSVNTGLNDTTITALVTSANYLWAGTNSQGVWRRELSQLIGAAPDTPGVISGSATVCQGSTNVYSVQPVSGATGYTWTLPGGWSGTSATNSITATAGSSGAVTVTANNSYGSSAAQTLNITVNTVNVSVAQSGSTLTAGACGATYQWVNCSGFTPLAGQTAQAFTAVTPGSYAVIVTQNGCTDTSACFSAGTACTVSISGADLPHDGFTAILSVDTINNVSIGNAGVSQTWNFSNLVYQYRKYAEYHLTSATPYAGAFPYSNIYTYGPGAFFASLFGSAPVGSGVGYVFWKSDNTGHWVTGYRADSGAFAGMNVPVTPNELLISAPASYGSVFNNSSRWELPMNLNAADADTFYVRAVTKTITADACGSLTTPHNTYPAVLREREYLITTDSIYYKTGSVTTLAIEFLRDTLNNYMYIANGIGYPVCIVHADKNNAVKNVEYYSGPYFGIDKNTLAESQFALYPNPANGMIAIEIPQGNSKAEKQIFVYNSVGSLVWQKNTSNAVTTIDVSNFPKGVYCVKINDEGKTRSGNFVVQ